MKKRLTCTMLVIIFILLYSCRIPYKIVHHRTNELTKELNQNWSNLTQMKDVFYDVLGELYHRSINNVSVSNSEILVEYSPPKHFDTGRNFYIYKTQYQKTPDKNLIKIDSYFSINNRIIKSSSPIHNTIKHFQITLGMIPKPNSYSYQNKIIYVYTDNVWLPKACIGSKHSYSPTYTISKDGYGQPVMYDFDSKIPKKYIEVSKYYDNIEWQNNISPDTDFVYDVFNSPIWSYDGIR